MRRLRGNDRGVAAVIVGISVLMVFAFLGFAVDAGAIYQERRELRNGADAGALAVAEDCVTGAKACSDAVGMGTAETYADLNADDGRSGVDSVEIDPVPANPDYDLTVRVVTSSEDGAGNAGLDFRFMKVVGIDSTTVRADATAAAGNPAIVGGLPLIFSTCEWYRGPDDPPGGPDEDLWTWGQEVMLFWHDGNVQEPCNGPAGQDIPGGFGWLCG